MPPEIPQAFIITGLPGDGKTHLAKILAEKLNATHLNTDVIRYDMFKEPNFSPGETQVVYEEISRKLDALLMDGRNAVVDGTFTQQRHRTMVRDIAKLNHTEPIFVLVHCPDEEIAKKRLATKDSDNPSRAKYEHRLLLQPEFAPFREPTYVIFNHGSVADLTRAAEKLLTDRTSAKPL